MSIEVVCGPMFSGKTTEMLRRVRRAEIAKCRVVVFKPWIDNRVAEDKTSTHDSLFADCKAVNDMGLVGALFELGMDENVKVVVGIDEYQFFQDPHLASYIWTFSKTGQFHFVIAGLDRDYKGEPFPMMTSIMGYATKVDKLTAVCVECGADAHMSHRKVESHEKVLIGGTGEYDALCVNCWWFHEKGE
jgi:thymidine kinase